MFKMDLLLAVVNLGVTVVAFNTYYLSIIITKTTLKKSLNTHTFTKINLCL